MQRHSEHIEDIFKPKRLLIDCPERAEYSGNVFIADSRLYVDFFTFCSFDGSLAACVRV